MTIYGFRGYSSGSEFALQIEIFAGEYVLPVFQGILPFYDFVVTYFLDYLVGIAHTFGNSFFDPVSIGRSFIDPILEKYDQEQPPNVLFSGINVGGLISKTLALVRHEQGIGFLSLPVFNDFFQYAYDFGPEDALYITNVYNYEGTFALPEPAVATNIGIPWVTSSSISRDTVYRSVCTMAELCGKSEQFQEFCIASIGEDELNILRHEFENEY
jgi:hypothetical protein